jgi:hypothetical protein
MARIVLVLMVTTSLAMAALAAAEEIHYANRTTLQWKMTWAEGQTPAPESEMAYKVYRTLATAPDKENPEFLAEIRGKDTFPVAFAKEGKYILGVRAVRYKPGKEEPIESPIGWSDVPENTYDKPFSVQFDLPPEAPTEVKAE